MSLYDNIYYAGYFDGEGCIRIQVNKNNSLTMPQHILFCSISSNNKDICESYKLSFGGSVIEAHYKKAGKTFWQWHIASNKAKSFLHTLEPFLKQKRHEALIAVSFQQNRGALGFAQREDVRRQLHVLKNNNKELKDYAKFI